MRPSVRALFTVSAALSLALLAALLWLAGPGPEARGDAVTGKITVSTTAIAGQQGKILIILASQAGGGQPVARACATIGADPFSMPATVMSDVPGQGSPCDGSTADTMFTEGSYTISAGVYVGGSQTPEVQTQKTVQVSGDTSVEIDGTALSATHALFGDVDCNGTVDSVDALKTLRHVAGLPVSQQPGCPEIGS